MGAAVDIEEMMKERAYLLELLRRVREEVNDCCGCLKYRAVGRGGGRVLDPPVP